MKSGEDSESCFGLFFCAGGVPGGVAGEKH